MKKQAAWVTATGEVYLDYERAKYAAEEAYGKRLRELALRLVECDGKIGRTLETLHKLAEGRELDELLALRNDRIVVDTIVESIE